jgi:hypothetical protein
VGTDVRVHVSLGTARNHVCRQDPCPICAPDAIRPRSYRCEPCNVYGRGTSCWSCGSTAVAWGRLAAQELKP